MLQRELYKTLLRPLSQVAIWRGTGLGPGLLCLFLILIPVEGRGAITIAENRWVQVTPTVTFPSGITGSYEERVYTKMVYNALTRKIISWEGFVDNNIYQTTIYSNSIWSYDVATNTLRLEKRNNWRRICCTDYTTIPLPENTTDPTPSDRHQYGVMAYVPDSNAIYIWGGANQTLPGGHPTDTWAFNLQTNAWQQFTPSVRPPVTLEAAMAYDPIARKLVMFGGDQGGAGRTFLYDVVSNAWSEITTTPQPPDRMGHAMVYDPIRRVTLLFGGGPWPNGGNDLWAFNSATNRWTQLTPPAPLPPPRKFHGFAYDSRNDVFLLLGGRNGEGGVTYRDTWAYLPITQRWVQLSPAASPSGPDAWTDSWIDMDYDPGENVFVARLGSGTWWLYRYSNAASSNPAPAPPLTPKVVP